ncbi:hypothetical protein FS842_000228 [Serendipita sp. 407]|nr:hypothetical protein FS842_000228 [Serendipita sp. 407]
MFASILTTLLLVLHLAKCAPLSQSRPLAPLYRRSDSSTTRYIVSIRDNTVDPANRLTWLNRILATSTPKVSAKAVDDDENGVVHQWDAAVFNGVAGHFDEQSLDILRAQNEVAWIEEGNFCMAVSFSRTENTEFRHYTSKICSFADTTIQRTMGSFPSFFYHSPQRPGTQL